MGGLHPSGVGAATSRAALRGDGLLVRLLGWYLAKQVGNPEDVLPFSPRGIVKLELRCGVMPEPEHEF